MKSGKLSKISFWITTGLISLMMLGSAAAYLTTDQMREAFIHLGFPNYFRIELAIAKLLGAVVLLAPFPARLKEWAYSGFTITLFSAFIAHVSSGDDASKFMGPVISGMILAGSYLSYQKVSKSPL